MSERHVPNAQAIEIARCAKALLGDVAALDSHQADEFSSGDRVADLYECASSGWGVSGIHYEFAFGPEFDDAGNAWVTLNVGFCGSLGKAVARWRGWALLIAPNGTITPVCDGVRSPNGIELNAAGDAFYVDNQGDYVATNRLAHLKPGAWQGHPASLRGREDFEALIRLMLEGEAKPPLDGSEAERSRTGETP